MIKKITEEDKSRFGVLWVLLNVSTDFGYPSDKICDVMNAIKKSYPQADRMWRKNFKITVDDKIVYEWHGN